MHVIQNFFSLSDPNVRNVLYGTILLGTSSAMIGTFAFLKKKTLMSDAIAHATLPGICLAFLITGKKHALWFVIGAFTTGWLVSMLICKIKSHSKIKQDTAIALVSSIAFGIGSFLLSILQHKEQANQGGVKTFLLGSAATLLQEDVFLLLLLGIMIVVVVLLFFHKFSIIAFDAPFAESIGIPVKQVDIIFTSLLVLSIIIGIRTVGIVLMSAMLITPAATARFWTAKIKHMIPIAMLISVLSSLTGTFISCTIPAMPTGPWIVLIMSLMAYGSFIIHWCRR